MCICIYLVVAVQAAVISSQDSKLQKVCSIPAPLTRWNLCNCSAATDPDQWYALRGQTYRINAHLCHSYVLAKASAALQVGGCCRHQEGRTD